MKTFIVPVIHVVSFGLDLEVQAENEEEAKKKALADRGEPSSVLYAALVGEESKAEREAFARNYHVVD